MISYFFSLQFVDGNCKPKKEGIRNFRREEFQTIPPFFQFTIYVDKLFWRKQKDLGDTAFRPPENSLRIPQKSLSMEPVN